MHPSQAILASKSDRLVGKTVVLGVTGSIAAVESVKLARELIRHGAVVIPVMSPEACRIVHPNALEFASGRTPVTELTGATEHVTLMRAGAGADLLLIAPVTANTIGKIVHGVDDTPVTTFASVALKSKPVILAPAMHEAMLENPFVKENVERLRSAGVEVLESHMDEGKAKLLDVELIVEAVLRRLGDWSLKAKRVLVVAGGTEEPIDAVRSVTNNSTGSTGRQIALEAYRRGAEVTLWMGRGLDPVLPSDVSVSRFKTTAELVSLAPRAKGFHQVIVPAAVSDYAPTPRDGKIQAGERELTLILTKTPKFVDELRRHFSGPLVVFKAEAGLDRRSLEKRARETLERTNAVLAVANDVGDVERDATKALLVEKGGAVEFTGTKSELACKILDRLR
ncbi:MAG: bifunctional phosphopantothenoylcysteine decarboxylase/phosphopantothenate--cysteine ligase CoaBC [Euryarchaeota archaeon]|nr:bifunctional phosphopantothenoylcysteine decarboxylase/phosphopantothenate--cysteine ligase CoaBC [Euryarchaeota archaeon]